MSKHTPTPWFVEPEYKGSAVVSAAQSLAEDGTWIDMCIECHSANGGKDENTANAEFIVRACNSHDALLEACKRVLDSPFEPDKWRINVVQAIEKASAQ